MVPSTTGWSAPALAVGGWFGGGTGRAESPPPPQAENSITLGEHTTKHLKIANLRLLIRGIHFSLTEGNTAAQDNKPVSVPMPLRAALGHDPTAERLLSAVQLLRPSLAPTPPDDPPPRRNGPFGPASAADQRVNNFCKAESDPAAPRPPLGDRRLKDSWLARSTQQIIRRRLKPADILHSAHPFQPQYVADSAGSILTMSVSPPARLSVAR